MCVFSLWVCSGKEKELIEFEGRLLFKLQNRTFLLVCWGLGQSNDIFSLTESLTNFWANSKKLEFQNFKKYFFKFTPK